MARDPDGRPDLGHPTIHQVNGQTQILCTPLVYRGLVYIIRCNGVLVVFDAKTGDKKYEQRLAGATNAFTSSPVANDGKVYAASEDGQVFVLKAGPTYEVMAMNEMSTPVLATPAISDGRLLLRTQDQVMAIGKKSNRGCGRYNWRRATWGSTPAARCAGT